MRNPLHLRDLWNRDTESPAVMRTMRFSAAVDVHYQKTVYSETFGNLLVGPITHVTHNPPKVENKTYRATRYTHYEAEKIDLTGGDKYKLFKIEETVPGLNKKNDTKTTGIADSSGNTLFSKEQVLAMMRTQEETCARTMNVAKDGAHTRRHISRYTPKA